MLPRKFGSPVALSFSEDPSASLSALAVPISRLGCDMASVVGSKAASSRSTGPNAARVAEWRIRRHPFSEVLKSGPIMAAEAKRDASRSFLSIRFSMAFAARITCEAIGHKNMCAVSCLVRLQKAYSSELEMHNQVQEAMSYDFLRSSPH